jgi:hypothetical protein
MSTISPDVTKRLAARVRAVGGDYLDAPVSGGEQGAINGTLSIMVGGEAATLERARPVFEAMGQRITHCGPVGAGQTVKLCNQIAVCLNNLAMAEALVFCQQSGVDPSVMIEAISARARRGSWQIAASREGRRARLRPWLQRSRSARPPSRPPKPPTPSTSRSRASHRPQLLGVVEGPPQRRHRYAGARPPIEALTGVEVRAGGRAEG